MLESTFTSIPNLIDETLPYLKHFKYPILSIDWNNAAIVPNLALPIFYSAGDEDEVIPYQHTL